MELARAMLHEAIYRQSVPGNLKEENPFTLNICSHNFVGNHETLFEQLLVCY